MTGEGAAVAGVAVAIALVGGLVWANMGGSTQGKFLAQCEERMLARLKAPSTYKRIEVVGPRFRQAEAADLRAVTGEVREGILDAAAAYTGGDRTFYADKLGFVYFRFTYDAANDYGTPIRGEFICEQRVYARKTLTDDGWPIILSEGN